MATQDRDACLSYPEFERDQMRSLDTLAAHYVQLANKIRQANKRDEKRKYFQEAANLYTTADKIVYV